VNYWSSKYKNKHSGGTHQHKLSKVFLINADLSLAASPEILEKTGNVTV